MHFLGNYGLKEIHGIKIAYLSGKYKEITQKYKGGYYSSLEVDSLLENAKNADILLTCDWPL